MTTRRYALRDDQWERIKDLLPGREGTVGVTAQDNRLFVEAVLCRYRAGMPWRDLPQGFGDFRVVHTRWSRWLSFHLTPGQACDLDGADKLLPDLVADTVLADKAYDADSLGD
jgi:hypothetical protein